jgi:hypothetical protein
LSGSHPFSLGSDHLGGDFAGVADEEIKAMEEPYRLRMPVGS